MRRVPRALALLLAPLALGVLGTWTAAAHARVASGTRVLEVEPVDASYAPRAGLRVIAGPSAECEAGSDSVGNAYRCFARNRVYDPCWTDDANPSLPAVICQERPWERTVTLLTLSQGGLEPFFSPPAPIGRGDPWGVQLLSGERCVALQGAHAGFDGGRRIVDYACASRSGRPGKRVLLQSVDRRHHRWTLASATYDRRANRYTLGPRVDIGTAWYATPDGGDGAAASADTCSASALAYTAQAYEAAHHEPDGPLPTIVHHACAGGFAVLVFTQDAPPPVRAASMAFHSSASGWVFSGSSEHIEPGQFGIPEEAYAQIVSGLGAAPNSENVSF